MAIGGYDSGSTNRLPTQKLFVAVGSTPHTTPHESSGVDIFQDFREIGTAAETYAYTETSDGSPTIGLDLTSADALNGVLVLDADGDAADEGAQVQFYHAVRAATTRTIAFEARVKFDDIASFPDYVVGLSSIDTTLIASNAFSGADGAVVATDGVTTGIASATVGDSGVYVDGAVDLPVIEDGEWHKIGLKIEGDQLTQVYFDGEVVNVKMPTHSVPTDANLFPSFAYQGNSTNDPIMSIDWFRLAYV